MFPSRLALQAYIPFVILSVPLSHLLVNLLVRLAIIILKKQLENTWFLAKPIHS